VFYLSLNRNSIYICSHLQTRSLGSNYTKNAFATSEAKTTTKMCTNYFKVTENDWRRRPEVEMVTGNRKSRVLQ